MAIPIIQPQTPNYAQWDWNPGATFLAAAKTTASMLDNIKQAEQIDRKLALDEKIKETMLPYEVLDAQAKIDHTKAQTALAASRSRALADGSQTAAILNGMGDLTTAQLYDIAGLEAPSETPPARVKADQSNSAPTAPSPIGGGDFKSIDLPAGPLQSFYQQDDDTDALTSIAGRLPDGSTMDELTNPKFSMASSSDSVSTDVAPRSAEMSVLKAKSFKPEVTNPLDWDENPAVTQTGPGTTPQKATWSSEAEQELKGIRSKLGSNPLESLPDVQPPRPEGSSIGAYISKRYNDLQTVSQKARNSKGDDRKTLSAVAMALEGRIYQDVASKYGIDDPVVVQNLVKGPGGLRRTADEIESIYGIMQDRSVEVLDNDGKLQQVPVTNWSEAFQAAEIKRNSLKSALKTKTKEDDSIERATKAQSLIDAISKKENRTDEDEMALQKLGVERDAALQLPQGASKLGGQLNRYFRQNQQLEEARNAGLSEFEGVTADQFDAQIASNMNRIQAIAIKNAPSFKNSAERDAWFQNEETKNLPFKMGIGGKTTVVYATEDPNVVTSYISNGKKGPEWVNYNMGGEKETPPPVTSAKAEPDGLMQEEETMLVKLAKTLPGKTKQAVSDFSDAVARSEIGRIPELEAAIKKIDEELASNKTFETALLPDRKGNRRLDKPLTPQERNQLIRNRNAYLIQLKGLKKRNPAPPTEYSTPTQSDL